MADDWCVSKSLVPFAVCIVLAKVVTQGSNGPVQVRIEDAFKDK
jgi:hypothetical protein